MLRSFVRTCLLLFVSEQPAYGYELVEQLRDLGVPASDPGTLYRSLRCLEDQGMLKSRWTPSPQGPDRRMYEITEHGLAALKADAASLMCDEATLAAFLDRYRALAGEDPRASQADAAAV